MPISSPSASRISPLSSSSTPLDLWYCSITCPLEFIKVRPPLPRPASTSGPGDFEILPDSRLFTSSPRLWFHSTVRLLSSAITFPESVPVIISSEELSWISSRVVDLNQEEPSTGKLSINFPVESMTSILSLVPTTTSLPVLPGITSPISTEEVLTSVL